MFVISVSAYVDGMSLQKLRVWCQLQNGQWESGQIQSISTETASVLLVNGSVSPCQLYS